MYAKVMLGLDEAQVAIAAMLANAAAVPDRPVAMAVVDAEGDLVAFARMDGVAYLARDMVLRKAYTSARLRMDTEAYGEQLAAGGRDVKDMGDPRFTAFGGGLVVLAGGAVVGAVAVSGRTAAEDAVIATAGRDAVAALPEKALRVADADAPPSYRRRIEVWPSPGAVEAEMEDHHHHFRIRLEHHDGVISATSATGIRVPWVTCPGGAGGIRALVGRTIEGASDLRAWATDRSTLCVHTVDLAVVAARHAHDSRPIHYEIWLVPAAMPQRRAVLLRDGETVLDWSLDGARLVDAGAFTGLSLQGSSLAAWSAEHLDADGQEAVAVLRRASHIAGSRGLDLDTFPTAGDVTPPNSSCHTYQPEIAFIAWRNVGTSRAIADEVPNPVLG